MTNPWKNLPSGNNPPDEINIFVEIPKGSQNKYELDKETGIIKLDRVLHPPWKQGNWDYGLIPRTFAGDGDPLDGMVIMDQASVPGIIIPARPVGLMHMIDSGEEDDKIICVPLNDPRTKNIKDIKDVPKKLLDEMKYFFSNYKKKEGKVTSVTGFENAAAARRYINEAIELYKKKFKGN